MHYMNKEINTKIRLGSLIGLGHHVTAMHDAIKRNKLTLEQELTKEQKEDYLAQIANDMTDIAESIQKHMEQIEDDSTKQEEANYILDNYYQMLNYWHGVMEEQKE